MDNVSKLIDTLKLAIYEIFATLLPGVVVAAPLWAGLNEVFGAEAATGLGLFVSSLIVGLALQGIANPIFKRLPKKWSAGHSTELLVICRARAAGVLGQNCSADAVLSFCLASIGADRADYDKFLALRDGARSLSIALPVGLAVLAWRVRPTWGPGDWVVATLAAGGSAQSHGGAWRPRTGRRGPGATSAGPSLPRPLRRVRRYGQATGLSESS